MQPVGPKAADHAYSLPEGGMGGRVLPRLLRKPVRRIQRLVNGGFQVSARGLASAAILGAAVAGATGLTATSEGQAMVARATSFSGLAIRHYDIEGNREVSDIEIIALLAPGDVQPIFLFDADEAREKLTTNSWIAEAEVSKVYPDRLSIRVIERSPFALWQNEDGVQIIDRQGRILSPFDGRDNSLPLVVGRGAESRAAAMLAQLSRFETIAHRARALIRVGDRRWDIAFDNGMRVMLPENGPAEALAELARLDREEQLFERAVRTVDLRIEGRLTLELDSEAAASLKTRRDEQVRQIREAGKGRAI